MTTTPVNHGAGLPARASKVTGRGQGGEGMRLKVPPACRANPAHFILAVAGVPAMREERLGRPQRAGRRAESEGRAGSKRGAATAPLVHHGTHGPRPARGPPQAREGGETMPAWRGSPGRTPTLAGHWLLLPGRRAAAGRRRERRPDRPRAPSPPPISACTSPNKSRGRRLTSSSRVPPEPEPVPVLVVCSSSGFRLLMVRGVG